MNKYIFSREVGEETEKFEILAEDLEEAQASLKDQIGDVFLPDYIEPTDAADLKLKTFSISYHPDPDDDRLDTVTYMAKDIVSAHGKFIVDFPDQAGQYRETHSPLSNYAVDRENEEESSESVVEKSEDVSTTNESPIDNEGGFFDTIFTQVRSWAKLFTAFFVSLIGLGLVSSVLFGIDGGFGVVTNIKNLLGEAHGLTGLVVVFLVYFLFIKSGKEEKT